jgi:hypothetical protein
MSQQFRTFLTSLAGAGLVEAAKMASATDLATPRDVVAHEGREFFVVRFADCRESIDNPDLHLIAVQPLGASDAPIAVLDRRLCRVVA